MGLKTTNYLVKKSGITLPTAYAKIRTLVLDSDGRIRATFGIQQSREYCDKYDPIEVVSVHTKNKWDRKTPLEKVAYEAVKQETYKERDAYNGGEVEKTDYNALFGWENNIV
jgi:polynucleotide 5'-kinase involved in rRNA processing